MAVKKKFKIAPRSRKTGLAAAPEKSFRWFNEYIRMDVDKKEVSSFIKTYIKANFSKSEQEIMLACPDYYFAPKHHIASTILWEQKGFKLPDDWNGKVHIQAYFDTLKVAGIDFATIKSEVVAQAVVSKRTPADIAAEKQSDFIAEIEGVLDSWSPKGHDELAKKYSVYNELLKEGSPVSVAKATIDYYTPLRDEVDELVTKKTPDLVEAYNPNFPVRSRKKYLAFIQQIIDDATKYIMSKKATRAIRKPKIKTADKQVAKLNYLTESKEWKLQSIHPMSIVGARRVFTFHTKYKVITEYVSDRPNGFEVKGSTLQGLDLSASRQTHLRKNGLGIIPIALGKSIKQIDVAWAALTTKSEVPNGRINKDTIIMRALDK